MGYNTVMLGEFSPFKEYIVTSTWQKGMVMTPDTATAFQDISALINLSPDLFCALDKDGRIVISNPQFSQVLGYAVAELQGKNIRDIVHPDFMSISFAKLEANFQGEVVTNFENVLRTRAGVSRRCVWSATTWPTTGRRRSRTMRSRSAVR